MRRPSGHLSAFRADRFKGRNEAFCRAGRLVAPRRPFRRPKRFIRLNGPNSSKRRLIAYSSGLSIVPAEIGILTRRGMRSGPAPLMLPEKPARQGRAQDLLLPAAAKAARRPHPRPGRPIRRQRRNAPVAQLDRAPDYESGGQEFESLRARTLSRFSIAFKTSAVSARKQAAGIRSAVLARDLLPRPPPRARLPARRI